MRKPLGNATACSGLANRLEAFDRQLVEGTQVVAELGAVVARRDAEVVLLREVIDADRALLGDLDATLQSFN